MVKKVINNAGLLAVVIAVFVLLTAVFVKSKFGLPGFTHSEVAGQYEDKRPQKSSPTPRKTVEHLTYSQIVEIRDMLKERRYEELNAMLEVYQEAFENDQTDENKVNDAYLVFEGLDSSFEKYLVEWKQHFSDNYQPYLAIAQYYVGKGYESRGSGWAKDTSKKQIRGMYSYFSKAEKDLKTALMIKPNLLPAYSALITITNASSIGGDENKVIRRAIELFPYSYILRTRAMWAKEPRWGGSFAEMEKIARDAEKYADINPRLTSLHGLLYYEKARTLRENRKYDEAIVFFKKTLSYDGFTGTYIELAKIYYYPKEEYGLALQYINKSMEVPPISKDEYLLRAKIHFKMGNDAEAFEDLYSAVLLNPSNTDSQMIVNKYNLDMLEALNGKGFDGQRRGVNWLFNPNANDSLAGWRSYKSTSVRRSSDGNNFFSVLGGNMAQDVYIPRSSGWFALFVGRASIDEKSKKNQIGGIPYIHAYMEDNEEIKVYVKGKELSATHIPNNGENNWVALWHIRPVPENINKIRFFMAQSSSEIGARFDDVGLFFFKSEEEAKVFQKKYFDKFDIALPDKGIARAEPHGRRREYYLTDYNASKWFGGENRSNYPARNVGTGQDFISDQSLEKVRVSVPFKAPETVDAEITLALRDNNGEIIEKVRKKAVIDKEGFTWVRFDLKSNIYSGKKYIFTWWLTNGYESGLTAYSLGNTSGKSFPWGKGYSAMSINGNDLSNWSEWKGRSWDFCISIEGDIIAYQQRKK